jgi:spermidine dehydrogenase
VDDSRNRALGMDRKITRRDFLNGVAVTAGASLMPWHLLADDPADPQKSPNYYPPALTGMRGSHPGSFDAAHSLRDGTFWDSAGKPIDTGETYDLIIVGGGISGLSAAHFYRKKAGENARILILDNHDDFGGHAKRNEFRVNGSFRLGFGGTYSIESPAPYSAVSKGLIEELGIDVGSYSRHADYSIYRSRGLYRKIFFDKETFGADRLLYDPAAYDLEAGDAVSPDPDIWKKFTAEAPLPEQARQDCLRLHSERTDYLPGLTSDQKKDRLARVSYASFLTDIVKVRPEVVRVLQARPHSWFGVGIDAVAAQDAWGFGYPGFQGMNLDPIPGKGMNRDAIPNEEAEKYFFHFPDGNASIARLLVRKLIPEAVPGRAMEDVILSKASYAKLEDSSSPVRIRLNSTAVRVKHIGEAASAKEVEVAYARRGKVYTAKAKNVVLACWHVVIPYICEELPDKQREALASAQKVPLLYTNVALHNWTCFQKLGANSIYAPGCYHSRTRIDLPVSIGGYECARKPEEPIVVAMMKAACHPGLPARDQHRAGRMELFSTTFEDIEGKIRDQLARMLGPGGFDPARDIAGITVNRWPHGYAYEYNSLFDSFWLEGGETPCEVARRPYGRIAIANADAGAYAYTDEAINQAWRAVGEIAKG